MSKRPLIFDVEAESRMVPEWRTASFTFVIEKFRKLADSLDDNVGLKSSVFEVKLEEGKVAKFTIAVHPKNQLNMPFVGLYLHNEGDFEVNIFYKFEVKKIGGSNWWESMKFPAKIFPKKGMGLNSAFNKNALINSGEIGLPGGSLTVVSEVDIFIGAKVSGGNKISKEDKLPSFGSNMVKMFNGPFTDIEIECNDKVFRCHKVVLASRSPVFKAMFEHESLEESKGKVIIKDVDSETLNKFIEFVYSDTVEEEVLKEHAQLLLAVADKYDVPRLKKVCEQHMCKELNVSNAAKFALMANLHQAKDLKAAAFKVIMEAKEEVMCTENWQSVEQNSDLMKELFEAAVEEKHF